MSPATGWPAGRSGELGDLRQPAAGRRIEPGAGATGPAPCRPAPAGRVRILGRGERHRCPGRPGPGRRAGPPRPGRRGDRPSPRRPRAGPTGPLRHLERPGAPRRHRPRGAVARPDPSRRPRPSCIPLPSRPNWPTPTGEPVAVSARGLLTAVPCRLSVEQGPWSAVTAWAGPWPSDERWWSRSRRRSARLQAVAGAAAHLLLAERGRWWVEATYG